MLSHHERCPRSTGHRSRRYGVLGYGALGSKPVGNSTLASRESDFQPKASANSVASNSTSSSIQDGYIWVAQQTSLSD